MTNREEKKKIAEQWMRQLGMLTRCINAMKNDKLWQSEGCGPMSGILYAAEPAILEQAKKIEEKQDALVWHAIKGVYLLGGDRVKMVAYLLVTNEDLNGPELPECVDGSYAVFAYVQNNSWELCSEYGDTAVKPANGGLRRVG